MHRVWPPNYLNLCIYLFIPLLNNQNQKEVCSVMGTKRALSRMTCSASFWLHFQHGTFPKPLRLPCGARCLLLVQKTVHPNQGRNSIIHGTSMEAMDLVQWWGKGYQRNREFGNSVVSFSLLCSSILYSLLLNTEFQLSSHKVALHLHPPILVTNVPADVTRANHTMTTAIDY